jgi:hypothetical protein
MSRGFIQSQPSAFGPRQRIGLLGLCLAEMLATACSVDVGKLRVPKSQARDATLPPSADVAGAGDDSRGGWKDAVSEVRPEGQSDLPDTLADVPIPVDLTGGAGGTGGDGPGAGTSGTDSGGTGGIGGDGGSNTTGGAGGGTGGLDGGASSGIDVGSGGMGGYATGGIGGGGTGGGTGGVATGGTGGVDRDGGLPDAPDIVDAVDTGPDNGGDDVYVPTVDPDLVLWYRFDESSGPTAYDSAKFGGVARNATLATVGMSGGALFSTVKQVGTNALSLTPSTYSSGGGYVVMPTLHDLAPEAITIAVWLYLGTATSSQNWERILDYADSSTGPNWFNLTARNDSNPSVPVFAICNVGHATADQQRLVSSTALPSKVWRHLAIVLPAGATAGAAYTGRMYIDGVVVATNNAMTVHLSDIGATANNWLGRSAFTSDPYFSGSMDDFRVYKRALSQQEIADLMVLR